MVVLESSSERVSEREWREIGLVTVSENVCSSFGIGLFSYFDIAHISNLSLIIIRYWLYEIQDRFM